MKKKLRYGKWKDRETWVCSHGIKEPANLAVCCWGDLRPRLGHGGRRPKK